MTAVSRLGNIFPDVAVKAPVRVATTAAITLSGLQTIDGITVVAGDRVLVKDQASATDNGVYAASTGNWQRTSDCNGNTDWLDGTSVRVARGTVNGGIVYILRCTDSPVVIGTSSLTFAAEPTILAAQTSATSTTSTTIGTGSKTFTIDAGKSFVAGHWVLIYRTSSPENAMLGQVTSYSGTSLAVSVTSVGGSGTYTDWTVALTSSAAAEGRMPPQGSGDVAGPGSSTDGGFARFNGLTGKLIKNSAATIGTVDIDALAVTTAKIADNGVTLAKLATQASHTILANLTGGAAAPSAATYAQVMAALGIAGAFYVNAADPAYGAVADCTFISNASITSGTPNLTSASNPWVSTDVGKTVCVDNAALLGTSTVTMTIASPGVVTWTANGLPDCTPIVLTTTGALPTGLTAGTVYYLRSTGATDTFQLSATPGGAAINTSGSQSGTHTAKALTTLVTTISAYVSAGAVTLTANAGFTASSALAQFGTDNTAAINSAIAALTHGGICYLPTGKYLVTSINVTGTGSVILAGSPWGVNFVASTKSGTVLVPIDGNYAMIDCTGTVAVKIEELQIGHTSSPVTAKVGILIAPSATIGGDAFELRNIFATGKFRYAPLYSFANGVAVRLWFCRLWNYNPGTTGFAACFLRDNHFGVTSQYQTISAGTGNAPFAAYEGEFHNFNSALGVTRGAAIYLRGVIGGALYGNLIDSSADTFGNILAEQASSTDCTVQLIGNTLYTETGNSPKYSYYCANTIGIAAFNNSYTFGTAKKGGGGTFNFGAVETT